ncbi:Tripartite DNA replication factor [Tulasnella sp. 417]|nr:Tripartite DNA replication factor [Tulasnella sp. 417]
MSEEIMFLSNSLVYNNRLRCGSEAVATQALVIPKREPLQKLHLDSSCGGGKDCWIESVLDPSRKSIFLDTDAMSARESRKGDLVQNEAEAQLIHQLVSTMVATGLQQSQIGIISPYRQQIKHLCHIFEDMPDVEILTADRSQGRDKDCIILSMVRSNEPGQVGDLLRDSRRMNVSLTRAKSKLIIVGSRGTLGGVPLLNQLFGLMQEKSWILNLPKYATTAHTSSLAKSSLSPPKRSLEEEDDSAKQEKSTSKAPRKKARTSTEAVVKGRFILQDLLNASS